MKTANKQPASLYYIVVTHYVLSALFFTAIPVMLFFSNDALAGHYFHPALLAITHTAALGWGTLIIFGACYQLLPVIFETNLYSYKLPWLSLFLFVTGLIALVCSFWIFDPGIHMQAGSLLLFASIFLFALNVFLTARKNKVQIIQQEFIITSCIWLLATALLGTMLVFNFMHPFLPKDHLHFLRLHAHMGIAGWFLLLIIGVSAKLVPMFLVSTVQKTRLLHWSYYLINISLAGFLVDGYISGISSRTIFIAVPALAGIVTYLVFIKYCFSSRLKAKIDLPIINTLISFILLLTAVVVLPLIIYKHIKNDPAAVRYTGLYGTLLFMGWISALILGQTFKTLPFIVWVKKYEHLAGKAKTPMPAGLFSNRLLKFQTFAFVAFLLLFYPAYLLSNRLLLFTGVACMLITALLYLVNIFIIIRHKTKTENYDRL